MPGWGKELYFLTKKPVHAQGRTGRASLLPLDKSIRDKILFVIFGRPMQKSKGASCRDTRGRRVTVTSEKKEALFEPAERTRYIKCRVHSEDCNANLRLEAFSRGLSYSTTVHR